MREFRDILRQLGLKETPKRRAILEVLSEAQGFLSPEEIRQALLERFTTIGLPTVYRNLEELAAGGVISTIIHPSRQLYYYFCTGNTGHHHHFICTSCRRVEDIPVCAMAVMEEEIVARAGGRVISHIVQVNGLCRECMQAA